MNDDLKSDLIEKQGLLLKQLRINNRLEKQAARRWEKRARRCENQLAELRERMIAGGLNPFSCEPPLDV